MTGASPSLSVVIATYRRPELLAETLESLYRAEPPPDEIVVVDGCPDRTARPVTDAFAGRPAPPGLTVLETEPSGTAQRNAGIDAARGEVIVFVDDDVTVARDVFARLAQAYGEPDVVGATGYVEEPASHRFGGKRSRLRSWLLGGGADGTFTRFGYPRYVQELELPADVEVMQGCFMSARREAAAAVRFDETLGGYSLAEDEDFSYRLSRRGRVRYLPGARVVHRKTGFTSHDERAFGRKVARNRSYLFRKNFPQTPLTRLQFALLLGLLVVHRLVNRRFAGALGLLEGAVTPRRVGGGR